MKKRIRKKLNRGEFTPASLSLEWAGGIKGRTRLRRLFFSEIGTNPPGVLIFIEDRLDGGVFRLQGLRLLLSQMSTQVRHLSQGTTDERRQSFVEWLSRSGVRDRLQIYDDNVRPLIPIPVLPVTLEQELHDEERISLSALFSPLRRWLVDLICSSDARGVSTTIRSRP